MPESVQSCFELFIHLSVKRTSRELLLKIVRGKKYREMYGKFKTQLDAFWHSYIPPIFFYQNPFPNAKSFQFMNFLEAMFYDNYLTSDFQTNTVISSVFAYSSKWRRKP